MKKLLLFLILLIAGQSYAQDIRYFNPAPGDKYVGITGQDGYQKYQSLDTFLFDTLHMANRDTIGAMIHDSLSNIELLPEMPPKRVHFGNFEHQEYFEWDGERLMLNRSFNRNWVGYLAGDGATNTHWSTLYGNYAGQNANLNTSVAFGGYALSEARGYNVGVGYAAGKNSYQSVSIGKEAGIDTQFGISIGLAAGKNASGIHNLLLGIETGRDLVGHYNVFLGTRIAKGMTFYNCFAVGFQNHPTKSNQIKIDKPNSHWFIEGKMGLGTDTPLESFHTINNVRIEGMPEVTSVAYLWGQKADGTGQKLDIANLPSPDLTPFVKYTDTASMLTNYVTFAELPEGADLTPYVKYTDTASMLENYVLESDLIDQDTTNELDTFYNYDGSLIVSGDTIKTDTSLINTIVTLNAPDLTPFVKYTDTALMLTNYVTFAELPEGADLSGYMKYTDTASMLEPYVLESELMDQDTTNELDTFYNYDGSFLVTGDTIKTDTSLINTIVTLNAPDLTPFVKYTDTALMLTNYVTFAELPEGADLSGYVKYTDTASMLDHYVLESELIDQDTTNELDTFYNYDGSFLVTGDTIKTDTSLINNIVTLNVPDLTPFVKYTDTALMLTNYVTFAELPEGADLSSYVKYTDTASMLDPYVRESELTDEYVNSVQVTGTGYKTLRLGRNIGGDITTTYQDLDTKLSFNDVLSMVSTMFYENVETGITVYPQGNKINFVATDPSKTNELQDVDQFELDGTNLKISLTQDPSVHTVNLTSLQSTPIWNKYFTTAYYSDGNIEARTSSNSSSTYFRLDKSDQTMWLSDLPTGTGSPVVYGGDGKFYKANSSSNYIPKEAVLKADTYTGILSSTTSYTNIENLQEFYDDEEIMSVGSEEFFQMDETGIYRISATIPITTTTSSKGFWIGLLRQYNGNTTVQDRYKAQVIVDDTSNSDVKNTTVHVEFVVSMGEFPYYKYSLGVMRADTNPGNLVVISGTTISIEKVGVGQ